MAKQACKDCGLELEPHVKVCPNCHTPQKMGIFKKVGFWLAAIFVLLFVAAIFSEDPGKAQSNRAQADATSSADDVQEDKTAYTTFYNDIAQKTDAADKTINPFWEAINQNDIIKATQIALNIKDSMNTCWLNIDRIKVPDLHNEDAEKNLDQAKAAISGAYRRKATFVTDFIGFAESQDIKKIAELKNTADEIREWSAGGLSNIAIAGVKLGVRPADSTKRN